MINVQNQTVTMFKLLIAIMSAITFLWAYTVANAAPEIEVELVFENNAGDNTQSASFATTTPNDVGEPAVLTLEINSLPTLGEYITIGMCDINFSADPENTNCSGNSSSVQLSDEFDNPYTTEELLQRISSISNVNTTVSGSSLIAAIDSEEPTKITYTTAEASLINLDGIHFWDATGGDITLGTSSVGVLPVRQVLTLTISGVVEENDSYEVFLPGDTDLEYIANDGDTTTDVANEIASQIVELPAYGGYDFDVATSTNTVTFTSKLPGVAFQAPTARATDGAAVAQRVSFMPFAVERNYRYTVTINDTDYTFRSTTAVLVDTILGMVAALESVPGVTCSNLENSLVNCQANVAGVSFTYAASVTKVPSSGGGSIPRSAVVNSEVPSVDKIDVEALRAQVRSIIAQAKALGIPVPALLYTFLGEVTPAKIADRDMEQGENSGDVVALQKLLISYAKGSKAAALAQVGATGLFGPLTREALAEFQAAVGINPAQGYFGPKTRAYLRTMGMME